MPAPAASGWSYNLRTGARACASDSDSSSSFSEDEGADTSTLTADAQLLKDLDLSSREETVQYKPNPWSIAKINAASRPPASKAPPARKAESAGRQVKGGAIADGFKRQEARAKARVSLPAKPPPPKARQNVSAMHIPVAHPSPTQQESQSPASGSVVSLEGRRPALHSPRPRPPAQSQTGAASSQPSVPAYFPSLRVPHGARPTPASKVVQITVSGKHASSPGIQILSPNPLEPCAAASRPLAHAGPLLRSPGTHISTPDTHLSGSSASVSHPMAALRMPQSFSSPMPAHHSGHCVRGPALSSPSRAGFRPAYLPSHAQRRAECSLLGFRTDMSNALYSESVISPAPLAHDSNKNVENLTVAPSVEFSPPRHAYTNQPPQTVPTHAHLTSEKRQTHSNGHTAPSVMPRWLAYALPSPRASLPTENGPPPHNSHLSEDIYGSTPDSLLRNSCQPLLKSAVPDPPSPPPVLSSAKRVCSPSFTPTQRRRKTARRASPPPACAYPPTPPVLRPQPLPSIADAYESTAFAPNTDVQWSTLPARKPPTKAKPSSQLTKAFRLPPSLGLGPSVAPESENRKKTSSHPSSTRRVVTYLPPPMVQRSTSPMKIRGPAHARNILPGQRRSSPRASMPSTNRLSECQDAVTAPAHTLADKEAEDDFYLTMPLEPSSDTLLDVYDTTASPTKSYDKQTDVDADTDSDVEIAFDAKRTTDRYPYVKPLLTE